MDHSDARQGELQLQKNSQATWRAGVVAAVVGGPLVPMWLIAVDRLMPLHWGLFPPHDYRRLFYIGLASAAVACVVSLAVARRRQPRGARISWDRWGITEWDGDGVRVAIPWSEATLAVRCDTGGESLALTILNRAHLSGFIGDGVNVIGLTLRIRGAHGREIWVTDGVQTPALAGRLTTVRNLGPLIAAVKGVRIVPMDSGHPGENLLALFYVVAIGGYVCATLGLGVLMSPYTVPRFVPHFLGGSAGCLALRALLPFWQHWRLGADERKLRGARRVELVDNDGPQLTAEDEAKRLHVIDTTTLAHPDARLQDRRGEAFMVTDRAGKVVAVETAAVRRARRTYRRAFAVEFLLRALLVIPVLAALSLFHARISVNKAWTVIAGPYNSFGAEGSLLADGSRALVETHTSFNNDLSLFDPSAEAQPEIATIGLGSNNTVDALALAPTGTRAVISRGSSTLVWEAGVREPSPRGDLAAAQSVVAIAFSRDGSLLLTGQAGGEVSVWDTGGFTRLHTFAEHTGEVLALAFSDDGALAVSGSTDTTARLLDLKRGTPGAVLATRTPVQAVAFLGETVVTGGADGRVRFFSTDGELERTVAAHHGAVTAIGLYPGGAFATAGDDHIIRVWAPDWRSDGSEDLGIIDMHADEDVRTAGSITGVAFSSARPALIAFMSHGVLLDVDLTRRDR